MSRPVESDLLRVVVSQRVERVEARNEVRDMLDQRLSEWLLQAGMLAIPVPNALQARGALAKWLAAVSPEAVILSGGNDIGSCPTRDATEADLLDYAAEHGLPLLGICRGMQMMACHAGASLLRVEGHAATRHPLQTAARVTGLPVEVNSYHNWYLADCPANYEIIATAADGTPEAIRHLGRSWEGWMWHPEREDPFTATDIERARNVLLGDKCL